MKISSTKIIPFLFLAIFLISACGENRSGNSNTNTSATNTNQTAKNEKDNKNLPKDDVEELEKIIKLPFHPEEATWLEDTLSRQNSDNRLPAPNADKLTVVFKFSAADAQKIVEQTAKYESAPASDIDAESWFPPELIAKSQESGDENLKGTSYNAKEFLQEPYKNGKITRIDNTDYFVLELTTF